MKREREAERERARARPRGGSARGARRCSASAALAAAPSPAPPKHQPITPRRRTAHCKDSCLSRTERGLGSEDLGSRVSESDLAAALGQAGADRAGGRSRV
eukprot:1751865-Rhodomonas_salina.1